MAPPRHAPGIGAAVAVLLLAGCGQDGLPTADSRPLFDLAIPDIVVTTTADDGPGSLRQAVADAATGAVIGFDGSLAGARIVFGSRIEIEDKTVTINAPSDRGITLDGDGLSGIFLVRQTGGLTLRNATVTGSYGSEGAVMTLGTTRIENSTITGNHSVEAGFSGSGHGAGLWHSGGSLTVVNSTITGNHADQFGGGITSFDNDGTITLVHTTVAANTAQRGGGIFFWLGSISTSRELTLQNSILAGNAQETGADCVLGDLTSFDRHYLGTNLLANADCEPRTEDIVAGDPVLGPLADNGGPTRTRALLAGSPAIETAKSACSAIATDQRYVSRPQGTFCDIGAFEFTGFVVPPLSVDGGATVSTSGSAVVSGRITCPAPATLTLQVTLRQSVKTGRSTAIVEATAAVPMTCGGSKPWSAALAPATGGFRNGSGTVTARTVEGPTYLQAAQATRQVKLAWARK
ncbi:MAG TPA: right-handed parallel beta-helix repeat-containing protein [Gemmatimonadales bacterium]|nr:right-handed parallel beta-helix repeat-containing protein [Gemmatimonadales bacterium]